MICNITKIRIRLSICTGSEVVLSSICSLSGNSYNPVIDRFFMSLAHRPSAYEELCSKFCFLGKFDILSPDGIERLAEKLVTLYQDDIEQRFSNELFSVYWLFE